LEIANTPVHQVALEQMPTVAEQLRRAREEQKLDIYQVAEITKIKTDHLRALEAGDFDAFAAPVYIRGFVRAYAKLLKLDESEVVAALEAELGQTKKFREPPPLIQKSRGPLDLLMLLLSRLNWRVASAIGGGALLLLLAWIGFHSFRTRNDTEPLKNLGPGLYQSRSDQSGELVPLPTNGVHK
jgi:cytoskeleton protein RodZ